MLIGEVAQRCGVSARMLRHYHRLGLVTPTGRTTGGYRQYSADDVRRLFHVESLRTLGLTLEEVKGALAEPDFSPDDLIDDVISRTRERIEAERELLARLERVQHHAPNDWADVVRVVTQARALESDSGARRQQAVLAPADDIPIAVDDLVAAILAEADVNVAGALRWALARTGVRALDGLVSGLRSTEVTIRRRAVLAIAVIDVAEATAPLRSALDDADIEVRDRAAIALAQRGDPAGVSVLVAMVDAGRRDVEAAEALGRLSTHGSTDTARLLGDALAAADAGSRLRITQALGEIDSPTADAMLVALTTDPDRTIRATAAVILDARSRR